MARVYQDENGKWVVDGIKAQPEETDANASGTGAGTAANDAGTGAGTGAGRGEMTGPARTEQELAGETAGDPAGTVAEPSGEALGTGAPKDEFDGGRPTVGIGDAVKARNAEERSLLDDMTRTDPGLVDLYKRDKDEGLAAYRIMKSENLGGAIEAGKWTEETPEQQEARQRKERMERNLVAAASMIGALGNFANAVGSKYGRAVSAPNLSEAVNRKQDEEKKQRDAAFAKVQAARKRMTEIMQGARKQSETNRLNREKNKLSVMKEERARLEYELKQAKTKAEIEAKQRQLDILDRNIAIKESQLGISRYNAETGRMRAEEAGRHNLVGEGQNQQRLEEEQRSNRADEDLRQQHVDKEEDKGRHRRSGGGGNSGGNGGGQQQPDPETVRRHRENPFARS